MARRDDGVPRLPADFVARQGLRAILDGAADVPVTLVCAPPGYGKTMLLADWLTTSGKADKAFVALSRADDDPGRFWARLLGALGECPVVPHDSPLRELVPPADPDADFVAELVDALDMLPDPLFLVLDDVHDITSPQPLHGIATLIRHRPNGLRLVLSSRFDPPLPLARLRPEGRLTEVRADALRFTAADTDRLLRAAGVRLRPDQLRTLVAITDGWAAGLRLAVRSLRDVPDRDAFLADFAARDRSLADYLVGEVLAGLSADAREFLRAVSVCDEVTPALAEALSGRDDAGRLLDTLAWQNSLVLGAAADPGWYRVHPVLRAYLRADLDRRRPDLGPRLHDVAARWFAADRPDTAIEHARQTGRPDTVADLLRRNGITLLLRGEHHVVRRGLTAVGAHHDPLLTVLSAFAHVQEGDPAAAEAELAGTRCDGELAELVTATCALAAGAPVATARIAALPVADGEPGVRAWARSVLGRALLADGDRAGAGRELRAARDEAREHGLEYVVLRCVDGLVAVLALAGDHAGMAAAGAESVSLARRSGRPERTALATGHAALGFACLFRCQPDAAAGHAARARRFAAPAAPPASGFAARVLDGAARFDSGHRVAGVRLLRHARQQLGDERIAPELVATAALVEHQACLAVGWQAPARDVASWAQERVGCGAETALLAAWTAVARGDTDAARDALRPAATDGLVPLTGLEARLVETALALAADERTRARTALAAALALAEPAALIRPFRHAPPSVRQLLVDQIGGFGATEAFAGRVHRALSVRDDPRGPLTAQERVVLRQLTSQRSLDEVAAGLSVSVNTVKTHVRAIYAKLGVNNRRAAVVTARERGLT